MPCRFQTLQCLESHSLAKTFAVSKHQLWIWWLYDTKLLAILHIFTDWFESQFFANSHLLIRGCSVRLIFHLLYPHETFVCLLLSVKLSDMHCSHININSNEEGLKIYICFCIVTANIKPLASEAFQLKNHCNENHYLKFCDASFELIINGMMWVCFN